MSYAVLVPFFGGRRDSTRQTIIICSPQHNWLTSFIVIFLRQCSTMSKTSQPLSHSDIIMTINGMLPMLNRNNPNDKAFEMVSIVVVSPPQKKIFFRTILHTTTLTRIIYLCSGCCLWHGRRVLVRTFINVSRSGKKRSSHQMMQ